MVRGNSAPFSCLPHPPEGVAFVLKASKWLLEFQPSHSHSR